MTQIDMFAHVCIAFNTFIILKAVHTVHMIVFSHFALASQPPTLTNLSMPLCSPRSCDVQG